MIWRSHGKHVKRKAPKAPKAPPPVQPTEVIRPINGLHTRLGWYYDADPSKDET